MIIIFIWGWEKIPRYYHRDFDDFSFISVIIPARNEEINITNILNDLLKQDFPTNQYEVIMVNDHSSDNTSNIMQEWSSINENYKYISLENNEHGKKAAIRKAVEYANGSLIMTSDADCRIPKSWIKIFQSRFKQSQSKIISGPVMLKYSDSIFSKMQALEFLSLTGSGAGSIGAGFPIMCFGANLAFEKAVYMEAFDNKYFKYASGDDIQLMLSTKKKYQDSIEYLKCYDAVIYTKPVISISEFFTQRKRWTSKSRGYKDKDIIISAIVVFLINLGLLASFGAIFFSHYYLFLFLFIIKSIPDYILLQKICVLYQCPKLLRVFLPLQVIYPLYITITAIAGNISKFNWKGRRLR